MQRLETTKGDRAKRRGNCCWWYDKARRGPERNYRQRTTKQAITRVLDVRRGKSRRSEKASSSLVLLRTTPAQLPPPTSTPPACPSPSIPTFLCSKLLVEALERVREAGRPRLRKSWRGKRSGLGVRCGVLGPSLWRNEEGGRRRVCLGARGKKPVARDPTSPGQPSLLLRRRERKHAR
ncbi:hypothetical protein BJY59DRAFT_689644 [Rhodotorula toruloides]